MGFKTLLESPFPVTHQWAYSVDTKLSITAPWALQVHEDSWKYPREIFFSSWSTQYPQLQPRSKDDSNYWRYEQYSVTLTDFEKIRKLRDHHFDIANIYDCVLKGIIKV